MVIKAPETERRKLLEDAMLGSLLNPGSSGDSAELNHGSQTVAGRRRPIKVQNVSFHLRLILHTQASVP
ncbi:hypothetical protein R3I93_017250 [Phoxinus phoxinus]|uniref:Uncharacterized protein n=1 Tax=Phoxinus phoxinus TaxID=58324 RepID=A0AAN9CI31_9TELE